MSYLGDDTNASSDDFKPVNEGTYTVTLEDVKYAVTKADGTACDPKVSLMWRMDNNMVLWTNLIFKDTTKGIVSGALEGLGVKEAFGSVTNNIDEAGHTGAAQAAYTTIATVKDKTFEVAVKHTPRNDGNGVWVNTYINKPLDKTVQNFAPQAAANSATSFNAEEKMPF